MNKKVLVIESDETTANGISALIDTKDQIQLIRASDIGSVKCLLETDADIKLVISLYEVSDDSEQRRDFFIQNLISRKRSDITSLSVGTINRTDLILTENKALLLDAEVFSNLVRESISAPSRTDTSGTRLAI